MRRIGTILSIFALFVAATLFGGQAAAFPSGTLAAAPAAQGTGTPVVVTCVVRASQLLVRTGPGTAFPAVTRLARNTRVRAVSFVARGTPSGSWIEVEQTAGRRLGFVAAALQFVSCNQPFTLLPAGTIPPVPIVTRTPAPTPTRLPALALVKVFGNDSEDTGIPPRISNDRPVNNGRNVLLPGVQTVADPDNLIFRDRLVFQVEVFDRSVGRRDGDGISTVTFRVTDPLGNVYEQREQATPYCAFGGANRCDVWTFSDHGNRWPNGNPLTPGQHSVEIVIRPKYGQPVTWFWGFEVQE